MGDLSAWDIFVVVGNQRRVCTNWSSWINKWELTIEYECRQGIFPSNAIS